MIRFFKRFYKHIAILIALTLIVQLLILFPFGKEDKQEVHANSTPEQDGRVAADISNLTGASVEEIMKLRITGKSWNEIIEILKSVSRDTSADKEQRSKLLTGAGIAEEDIKKWIEQGFSNEEIMEARMMADRVQFQLKEMTESSPFQQVEKPSAELSSNKREDDKQAGYKKIVEGFEVKTAVSFMLQLKKEFGSFEAVLDEYLLSLQIGISLEDYINDKEQFLKQKAEKSIGIMHDQLITLNGLEQDVLNKMKSDHALGREDLPIQQSNGQIGQDKEGNRPLPDVPVPHVKDVKPVNPTEQINDELKRINPNQQ
ncbi:hypothetical protein ACFQ88_10720 [Paenibacillus sp. NPDC056579]|uniref:hypothetical protein n=1 Tax=Paenibacillus sp. NPDC056579 TaxID=3345871 RepID=UPI0036B0DBCC